MDKKTRSRYMLFTRGTLFPYTTLFRSRQGENHESKGKKVPNLQGKTDQVCNRPIHRNLAGQKGMAGYIQCAESKNMQPRILYPARLSFKTEGESKSFPDKQKLKEFVTTKPAMQEILRRTL